MSYVTVEQVKAYRGIESTDDDALILTLIDASQSFIEKYTDRVFEASADATRTIHAVSNANGPRLYLDRDLAAITSVTTDSDGTPVILGVSDYITYPSDRTPYWAIEIRSNVAQAWVGEVEIVGRWAYSVTPPSAIVHAAIRLASYFYAQKDAQVFDIVSDFNTGLRTIPMGIPKDVKLILDGFMRVNL